MAYFENLDYDGTAKTTSDGFKLALSLVPDHVHGAPWDEEDGHGAVRRERTGSNWRNRNGIAKAPGELVLWQDRGEALIYDYAGAVKLAFAEGWGCMAPNAGDSAKQRAARAAMDDFKRLKNWCNNEWHYVGAVVTASRDGIELGNASLWGIESDAGDYLLEVANELAPEALEQARGTIDRLIPPYTCTACGRPEDDCSAEPCEAVIQDRAS